MIKKYILTTVLICHYIFLFSQECTFTEVNIFTTTGSWAHEMSWRITTELGEEIISFQGEENDQTYQATTCLQDGCYLFEARDSYGDGWNGGFVLISFDEDTFVATVPMEDVKSSEVKLEELRKAMAESSVDDKAATKMDTKATTGKATKVQFKEQDRAKTLPPPSS